MLRVYYLGDEIFDVDPTLNGVLAAIITQVEISYAIITTITPSLRPFMSARNTSYGGPAQTKTSPTGTKMSNTARSGEVELGSVMKSRERPEAGNDQARNPRTRWDQVNYRAAVVSGDQRSTQSDDSKQMIISKNTEWAVEYGDLNQADRRQQ